MSSPIGCFLLNEAELFNASGQSVYHGGQTLFSYPVSFSTHGNKLNFFVSLRFYYGRSGKIIKLPAELSDVFSECTTAGRQDFYGVDQ